MPQLTLALSPDECVGALQELVEQDSYIEDLERKLKIAKDTAKDLKEELKDAVSHRTMLSWRAREGAVPVESTSATTHPSEPGTSDGDALSRLGETLERQRVADSFVAGDLSDNDEDGATDADHDEDIDLDDDRREENETDDERDTADQNSTIPVSRGRRTG